MPATDVDVDERQEQAHLDYRAAKDAVTAHRQAQHDAELARSRWMKSKRGVPSHLLFDRITGDPTDPELIRLDAAVAQAVVDVRWCLALVVACGEVVKGVSFDEVPNEAHPRHQLLQGFDEVGL